MSGFRSSPRTKRYVGVARLVEDAGNAVLLRVRLAGHGVDADVVRLEEGAEPVVVGLRDRVVLVVVAAGAVQRQAEEPAAVCSTVSCSQTLRLNLYQLRAR